jgi:hypothetical protein
MPGGRNKWSVVVVTAGLVGAAGWFQLARDDREHANSTTKSVDNVNGSADQLVSTSRYGHSNVTVFASPARETTVLGSDMEAAPADARHGVRESPPEAGESSLTLEWHQMAREERIEEGRLAFERSIAEAERTRSLTELRAAASSLSALQSDLLATPEGRQLYKRMEMSYDELEQKLE